MSGGGNSYNPYGDSTPQTYQDLGSNLAAMFFGKVPGRYGSLNVSTDLSNVQWDPARNWFYAINPTAGRSLTSVGTDYSNFKQDIDDVVTALDNGHKSLFEGAVDEQWTGTAADHFKSTLERMRDFGKVLSQVCDNAAQYASFNSVSGMVDENLKWVIDFVNTTAYSNSKNKGDQWTTHTIGGFNFENDSPNWPGWASGKDQVVPVTLDIDTAPPMITT